MYDCLLKTFFKVPTITSIGFHSTTRILMPWEKLFDAARNLEQGLISLVFKLVMEYIYYHYQIAQANNSKSGTLEVMTSSSVLWEAAHSDNMPTYDFWQYLACFTGSSYIIRKSYKREIH